MGSREAQAGRAREAVDSDTLYLYYSYTSLQCSLHLEFPSHHCARFQIAKHVKGGGKILYNRVHLALFSLSTTTTTGVLLLDDTDNKLTDSLHSSFIRSMPVARQLTRSRAHF